MGCDEALETAARRHILNELTNEGDDSLLIKLLLMLGCKKEGDVISHNRLST